VRAVRRLWLNRKVWQGEVASHVTFDMRNDLYTHLQILPMRFYARTRTGDIFVRNAIQMNLLTTTGEVDLEALAAAASEKDRRQRAKAFKDLRVLMLDALADPMKRGEAIQQFVRLYRTPARSEAREIVRSNCTGC